MSHVHVHAPHELTEAEGGASAGGERRLELAATLLLAFATLGIAWSGYQAARWSGLRVATRAGQDRIQDLLNFNRWLEVSTEGDTQLTALYERRFRPAFRPAFEAWLAEDPINNPDAVASPLREPQHHPAAFARADRFAVARPATMPTH